MSEALASTFSVLLIIYNYSEDALRDRCVKIASQPVSASLHPNKRILRATRKEYGYENGII